jgi:hypothetical protein
MIGYTTTWAIIYYYHKSCELDSNSWQGVFDTLCDKVCQWPVTSQWFSHDTPVSSTNQTDGHDIADILLKVALNTLT